MQKKHKRQNTAICLKQPEDSFLSNTSSSSSNSFHHNYYRRYLSGSVYLQAYRWAKDENFSTDFDSFFTSSVEVMISEIDRISENEPIEEKSEFKQVMQDIVKRRVQIEHAQAAAKKKLRNSLLLLVNLNAIS